MINEKRLRTAGFTLVELLVVISIIAMLLAVLMPALSKAKANAVRIVCASNLKQTGLCMSMYTNENEYFPTDYMPPRATSAGDFTQDYWQQKLVKYAKNGKVLSCPYFEKMVSSGKTSVEGISMSKLFGKANESVNWYYWYCSGKAQSFGYNHLAFGCGGYAESGFRCYSRTKANLTTSADIMKPALKVKQTSVRNPSGLFLVLDNVSSFAIPPYAGDYKERYHPNEYRHSGGANVLYADIHCKWQKIDSQYFELNSNDEHDPCWGDTDQIK